MHWWASACLVTLASNSDTAKYAADSIGAGGRPIGSAVTSTRGTESRARARMASTRPRSARTGGWMPLTRARSSASAMPDA